DVIERYLQGERTPKTADLIFLGVHLLAEWREKAAYRPLVRLLRSPEEVVEYALGDCITETSHRVMAAVFDGDPQPLYDLILDPAADEYVRSRMCEALAMTVLSGELPRADVAQFLRAGFTDLEPQQDCVVWIGWQSAIALLGLEELTPLVKQAYDCGFSDPGFQSFDDFKTDLQWALEHPDSPGRPFLGKVDVWTDTISELSSWPCFN